MKINVFMAIRRSCEEGKYLLIEGDCVWRVCEAGKIDCSVSGSTTIFELLNFLQTWKTPSRRLLQHYPLQDTSNEC